MCAHLFILEAHGVIIQSVGPPRHKHRRHAQPEALVNLTVLHFLQTHTQHWIGLNSRPLSLRTHLSMHACHVDQGALIEIQGQGCFISPALDVVSLPARRTATEMHRAGKRTSCVRAALMHGRVCQNTAGMLVLERCHANKMQTGGRQAAAEQRLHIAAVPLFIPSASHSQRSANGR